MCSLQYSVSEKLHSKAILIYEQISVLQTIHAILKIDILHTYKYTHTHTKFYDIVLLDKNSALLAKLRSKGNI